MKLFLKRLGIFLVLIGVVILAWSEFSKMENNGLLILSGGLIVGGLVFYIIINNILGLDE